MFNFVQDIFRRLHENGPLAEKTICALTFARVNRTGYGKDIAVLIKCKLGGDECAALFARFNNDRAEAQATDDAVAPWKVVGFWAGAQWKF